MIQSIHYFGPARCSITSFLRRMMYDCERFGARYQYSPRLMIAGLIFTGVQLAKSALLE